MSEIITFYSYKGGVGRTMALANVSALLSKWGHKVLVVDWDLEAPGLEHFYKDYISNDYLEGIKIVESKFGVIDMLQLDENHSWQDNIIPISIYETTQPIHLISSGKRDENYFTKVRGFDVNSFYENGGGDVIEKLRSEWLDSYDYVLIDSRTGITEIGGICTIQLPDTVVMLFTATNQGFDGVLDIIKRAGAAQQKLPYDRQKLIFLPIPAKFETNTEFELSQKWLNRFATELDIAYNDWLPTSVNKKDFLDLTKIPYIPYFSFGEKLPVIEQGTKDPSGLRYAYETLACLVGNRLNNVDQLINDRDKYVATANKNGVAEPEIKKVENEVDKRLKLLRQKMNINEAVVKIEKNKDIIIDRLNNISVLLESISTLMKEFGSFFKNKDETIDIYGDYSSRNSDSRWDTSQRINVVSDLNEIVKILFDSKKDYNLNTLFYSCSFRNLRRSGTSKHIEDFVIVISFHNLVYEIKSEDGSVSIDKLYHEILTPEESSFILQTIRQNLLEKIESALKE